MHGPQRLGDAADRIRLAHAILRQRRAFDETRHEAALGLEERDHLRADPDGGRGERRLVLDGTVDPEQTGVATGDPEDVCTVVERHLPVVVRDAAAQELDPSLATGPHAGDDRVDVHGAILSCRNGGRRSFWPQAGASGILVVSPTKEVSLMTDIAATSAPRAARLAG